jgi:hypothetical protein
MRRAQRISQDVSDTLLFRLKQPFEVLGGSCSTRRATFELPWRAPAGFRRVSGSIFRRSVTNGDEHDTRSCVTAASISPLQRVVCSEWGTCRTVHSSVCLTERKESSRPKRLTEGATGAPGDTLSRGWHGFGSTSACQHYPPSGIFAAMLGGLCNHVFESSCRASGSGVEDALSRSE